MDKPESRRQLLLLFPAFRQMPATTVDAVLEQSPLKRLAAGNSLFAPGSPCLVFPVVVDGIIKVSRTGPRGRELPLYRVFPGQTCVLTSTCLLSQNAHNANGVVEKDLSALAMPADLFNRLIAEAGAFRQLVFGAFGDRLLELIDLVGGRAKAGKEGRGRERG